MKPKCCFVIRPCSVLLVVEAPKMLKDTFVRDLRQPLLAWLVPMHAAIHRRLTTDCLVLLDLQVVQLLAAVVVVHPAAIRVVTLHVTTVPLLVTGPIHGDPIALTHYLATVCTRCPRHRRCRR